MLKKIISGGQTGADRAALDIAIKFNIEHGGWVPKGRKAEDGQISHNYNMQEMLTSDYSKRTEQNILDSHGTLIISNGKLKTGSLLTKNFAFKHKIPCFHIDVLKIDEFEASIILNEFISENKIKILNVAGPRKSNDPEIYTCVKIILETLIYMIVIAAEPDGFELIDFLSLEKEPVKFYKTIHDAVVFLADTFDLKTRYFIANSDNSKIAVLYFYLIDYIRIKLGLDSKNKKLLGLCYKKLNMDLMDINDAVMVILKDLKTFLEKDHVLKVVQ